MTRLIAMAAGLALSAAALPAGAYCIHNDLKDRNVSLTQEQHPQDSRNAARLKALLKPGTRICCEVKNLDCNPDGKVTATIGIDVAVETDPPLKCGPVGVPPSARMVKVTGGGDVRIMANPRFNPKANDGTSPYVARVYSQEKKDMSGPNGLPCK
jgi:hypothetical protein